MVTQPLLSKASRLWFLLFSKSPWKDVEATDSGEKKTIKVWSVVTGPSAKDFLNKMGYYFNVPSISDVITQIFANRLDYP